MTKITRHEPTRCPICKVRIDSASSPEGHTPKPQDLSICMECFAWLQFTEGLKLKPLTQEDIELIKIESPDAYEQMIVIEKMIKELTNAIKNLTRWRL